CWRSANWPRIPTTAVLDQHSGLEDQVVLQNGPARPDIFSDDGFCTGLLVLLGTAPLCWDHFPRLRHGRTLFQTWALRFLQKAQVARISLLAQGPGKDMPEAEGFAHDAATHLRRRGGWSVPAGVSARVEVATAEHRRRAAARPV